ncbi:anthrone oxygenase family protein [Sphaerisporangium fuscum]|uniref:anthrone oxygenase family protein n=1 Tax=Sphaerisporangium fuscum TaxID=2835868 RepID=UPI001BDCE592|nr:anthrone oxygenase family protein [Sphaerisporangium fuscum]
MLHTITLVLATITTGLIAGLFYGFTICVMLALRQAGDRTFIEVMQRINTSIQNGWFALAFLGAPVFAVIAMVAELRSGNGIALEVAAGFALYVLQLVITFGVNIPLNNRLDAAGSPDGIADPAAVRRGFEPRWVRWNTIRGLVTLASFACLSWGLLSA